MATDVDRDPFVVEQAGELLAMLSCPYLMQTGDKTCQSGCQTEPACHTDGPWHEETKVLAALIEVAMTAHHLCLGLESGLPVPADAGIVKELRQALEGLGGEG